MRLITSKILKEKYGSHRKLFTNIELETSDNDFVIPEWQKEVVLERIKNAKEEDFFSIDELDKKINL